MLEFDFESMTREKALGILVELDIARWGEAERDAINARHRAMSRGRLINSIVHHPLHDYGDAIDPASKKAAKRQLTEQDRLDLRSGG